MGCEEKYTAFGIINEDSGELYVAVGSSAKTSDFIVDSLTAWRDQQSQARREGIARLYQG